MRQLFLPLILALGIALPAHTEDLAYSDIHTDSCLQEAVGAGEQSACIGASATQCMADTQGGESTVGMGACLMQTTAEQVFVLEKNVR